MLHEIVAHHPIGETPYKQLIYVGASPHGIPLYRVLGTAEPSSGARKALLASFKRYGGRCYYCHEQLSRHAPLEEVSTDHVVPTASGGADLLHNLVIACKQCNQDKSARPIHEFRPEAGNAYLEALERHLAEVVLSAPAPSPSAPPPPTRGAAAVP